MEDSLYNISKMSDDMRKLCDEIDFMKESLSEIASLLDGTDDEYPPMIIADNEYNY